MVNTMRKSEMVEARARRIHISSTGWRASRQNRRPTQGRGEAVEVETEESAWVSVQRRLSEGTERVVTRVMRDGEQCCETRIEVKRISGFAGVMDRVATFFLKIRGPAGWAYPLVSKGSRSRSKSGICGVLPVRVTQGWGGAAGKFEFVQQPRATSQGERSL